MGNVKFTVNEEKEFTLISFEMDDILSPEDLVTLTPPEVNGAKGVVLSGRGPIWLYCFLTHVYDPTKFIATYDPRLEGAVIVERYSADYKVGSIMKC
jgi:CRISPR-associated protein Csx3